MSALPAADGRRARGDATRRLVARAAADIATTHGLDGITVGGLSASTGVSKSGILTVFGNREAIQLAAVAEARRVYIDVVIRPALSSHWWTIGVDRAYVLSAPRARRVTAELSESPVVG
ncbi:TetR/AcrR family transcriptional regulator [Mycolicibacterium mageritense]